MTAWEKAWKAQVAAVAKSTAAALSPPDTRIGRVWLWSGYKRLGRLVIRWRKRVS